MEIIMISFIATLLSGLFLPKLHVKTPDKNSTKLIIFLALLWLLTLCPTL